MMPREAVEFALGGDGRGRLDEGVHRHARQRAADADAPHAHAGKIVHREAERAMVEEVDRLAADRLHGRLDLLAGLDARRIEAVRARVRKRLQPADGLVEVRPAADEAFGARGEHHVAAGLVDRRARGLHPRQRLVEIVQRKVAVLRRILDRQSGDAGRDAARHVLGHVVRIVGEAVLEIGVERNVGLGDELLVVRQHVVARLRAVGIAFGMRVAGAGRGDGLEAEALKIARAADVPRVRNDEAAALVQLAEGLALVGGRRTGGRHGKLPAIGEARSLPRWSAPGQRISVMNQ